MKKLNNIVVMIGTFVAGILNIAYAQQSPSPFPNNQSQPIASQPLNSNQNQSKQTLRIGIVNTKKCVEESKLGKQEQANLEKMKKQMQSVLQDKERALEEIESQLNDDDYMDSISEEKASELKRKKRMIRTEGMQLQSQYMETLQQANLKVIQRLTDVIAKASAQVAKDNSNGQPLDVIFTDEACTFYAPDLDVSNRIVAQMNVIYDAEQKEPSKAY